MSENRNMTNVHTNQIEYSETNQGSVDCQVDVTTSLLRLLVGGTLEGADEVASRLQEWEEELAKSGEPITEADIESLTQYVRTVFIGLLFASKWQLSSAVPRFLDAADTLARWTMRPFQRLTQNTLVQGVQARFDYLEERGKEPVTNWLEIGLSQEPRARKLARYAAMDVVNDIIAELAENPELEALVQQQSVGLASEIVDGVRTQTVTADTVVERSVRKILGRPARPQLVGPDNVDSDSATSPF